MLADDNNKRSCRHPPFPTFSRGDSSHRRQKLAKPGLQLDIFASPRGRRGFGV